MAGVHVKVTPAMVTAALDVLNRDTEQTGVAAGTVENMIRASLRAGEISMGDEPEPDRTVKLTFTNHQGEIESVRLPVGAAFPYDFGPRGLAFRKVQVTR